MMPPVTYQAAWWVPDGHRRFSDNQYTGVLTYHQDENSTLEIILNPSNGSIGRAYEHYDVIYGQSADGHLFTLFDAILIRQHNFTQFKFRVNYILLDTHVDSLEKPVFDRCVAFFTYLKDWAFSSRVSYETVDDGIMEWRLDLGKRDPVVSVYVEKGIKTYLWGELAYHLERFSSTIEQATNYVIETEEKTSIREFLALVSEFSEFLSIALFAQQHPNAIKFKDRKSDEYFTFLFKIRPSNQPGPAPLINYERLAEKVPNMLFKWHSQHDQVAPISNYLIRSMKYDTPFDAPDFLIVAHALDGYFKRFINGQDGKDTQQYKHGIDKLLKRFSKVEAVCECKIDSEALRDSRDKYSHLLPDGDNNAPKAVKGPELYWLTAKCKVLLSCCILDMLGLSIDEINECSKNSPISLIVNSIPLEFKV